MRCIISTAVATLSISTSAHAQLFTAYTGDEPGARSWLIDVQTGEDIENVLGGFQALAHDPVKGRIFASSGRNLVVYAVDAEGNTQQDGSPRIVIDQNGDRIISITSFAWGNDKLYAAHTGLGDAPGGLYVIDVETRIDTPTFPQVPAELVLPITDLPLTPPIDLVADGQVRGLTFDTDRNDLLIGGEKFVELDGVDDGEPGPADEFENRIGNDILVLDPETGAGTLIVEIPFSLGEGGFDGLAYGNDRIYLDCGAPCDTLISVYNRVSGEFEQGLPLPSRNGNGAGGATFVPAIGAGTPCNTADLVAPFGVIDFMDVNAFVAAFAGRDPIADIAAPFGFFDLGDINSFVAAFLTGCP